jgi:hypothetical protein
MEGATAHGKSLLSLSLQDPVGNLHGRGCSYWDGLVAAKSSVKPESIPFALWRRRPEDRAMGHR